MDYDGPEGQSKETSRKQDHFRYFMQVHLNVVRAIQARCAWSSKDYVYVDLTAGSGIVDGREGSPLIFIDEANKIGQSWQASFCEINLDAAHRLNNILFAMSPEILGDQNGYRVYPKDHGGCLAEIIDTVTELRKPAYGLVYADPNGTLLPIEVLRMLTEEPTFFRIDILCYVSATTYKRVRKALSDRFTLLDDLKRIRKQYIYVRQPYTQHQWAFVFLTNWSGYPEIKKIGFHRDDSPEGRAILDRLDRTNEERSGQQEIKL